MVSFFVVIAIFAFLSSSENVKSDDGWVDRFADFDTHRWEKIKGYKHCSEELVWLDEKNVVRHDQHGDNGDLDHSMMTFTLDNNCKGKECCNDDGDCAQWRAGILISVDKYRFGSFRFAAKPASHEAVSIGGIALGLPSSEHAWSCYGACVHCYDSCIENSTNAFGICVLSGDPHLVRMTVVTNGTLYQEYVRLRFNIANRVSIYRIDWYPEEIVWYIDGRVIFTTYTSNWEIPKDPLHIVGQIARFQPLEDPDGVSTTEYPPVHKPVEFKMHLYRFRYIKFHPIKEEKNMNTTGGDETDKTELFILSESQAFRFGFVLISIITLVVIFIFALLLKYQKDEGSHEPDQYILLEEAESKHGKLVQNIS